MASGEAELRELQAERSVQLCHSASLLLLLLLSRSLFPSPLSLAATLSPDLLALLCSTSE